MTRIKRILPPLIIGLLFFAGIAYSLYLGDSVRYLDEREYLELAHSLAFHQTYAFDGIHPTAWRPPGYPLILAPLIAAGANLFLLRLLHFFFFIAAAYLSYSFLQKRTSLGGIFALLLIAAYPVLFYAAGTFYPQIFGMLLLVIFLHLFFADPPRFFWCGVVSGYLILTIPTFVFLLAFSLLWILGSGKGLKSCLTLVIGAVLIVAPWTIRNYVVFHSVIFVSTNSGLNLLLGNSENAQPNQGVNTDLTQYREEKFTNEVERDRFYQKKALEYIWEHPKESAILYVRKFINYFNFWNVLATQSEASEFRAWTLLFTYGFLVLLALARLGLYRLYPILPYEGYLLLLYLFNGIFSAFFFTRIRFRLPYDLLLILFNASFLGRVCDKLSPKKK